jgi:hypothetical protein
VVKWCSECGAWGDHYRAGHTAEAIPEEDALVAADIILDEEGDVDGEEEVAEDLSDGAFARLRMAGLL